MAIAPTGAIYKSLIFDGENSRNYGVYITGEAVFNAPERDVEMITIPARNGLFALDQGRFENIEVTYPAGIFADTEADFAQAISDFRNFLCSRKGYVRLTDDYNPAEYRMAIYKSGLDVKPAQLRAGEFNITFDCQPQRFLTSGDTAVTVGSGHSLTNPTLFESSPLLAVKGYGNIAFNGYQVQLNNVTFGNIDIARSLSYTLGGAGGSFSVPHDQFNSRDSFYIDPSTITFIGRGTQQTYSASVSGISGTTKYENTETISAQGTNRYTLEVTIPRLTFAIGLSQTYTCNTVITMTLGNNTGTCNISVSIIYYPSVQKVTISTTLSWSGATNTRPSVTTKTFRCGASYGTSTISVLGNPTYVDCDLGEAYKIENGSIIGINAYVDLGSKLPKLGSGSNTFTCDGTVTELKVVPRWWKV